MVRITRPLSISIRSLESDRLPGVSDNVKGQGLHRSSVSPMVSTFRYCLRRNTGFPLLIAYRRCDRISHTCLDADDDSSGHQLLKVPLRSPILIWKALHGRLQRHFLAEDTFKTAMESKERHQGVNSLNQQAYINEYKKSIDGTEVTSMF